MQESNPGVSIDLSLCHQLVELERKRKTLEKEVKETKKKIEGMWKPILNEMTKAGLRNISLEDGVRLQPTRAVECSKRTGVDMQTVIDALRKCGWEWLVSEKYAPGKLKARIKEIEEERKEAGDIPEKILDLLPENLRSFFNLVEINKIVVYGA